MLTVALANAILNNSDYGRVMREYYRHYPYAGYGGSYLQWASDPYAGPYNSWGNGSAMRTSPVGFAFDTLDEVLAKAKLFASYTHNHPEGGNFGGSSMGGPSDYVPEGPASILA